MMQIARNLTDVEDGFLLGHGRLIDPDETAGRTEGRVVCRERLGGLLKYDNREAA